MDSRGNKGDTQGKPYDNERGRPLKKGRGDVGSNATCVLGSDQSSEIMRKWEEGIIGSSVNPVRKDRALTTPFL